MLCKMYLGISWWFGMISPLRSFVDKVLEGGSHLSVPIYLSQSDLSEGHQTEQQDQGPLLPAERGTERSLGLCPPFRLGGIEVLQGIGGTHGLPHALG
jgi:hypothetical protein